MAGKNRLVPIVLGITKQSVVRMDEKTKEVTIGMRRFVSCLKKMKLCLVNPKFLTCLCEKALTLTFVPSNIDASYLVCILLYTVIKTVSNDNLDLMLALVLQIVLTFKLCTFCPFIRALVCVHVMQ